MIFEGGFYGKTGAAFDGILRVIFTPGSGVSGGMISPTPPSQKREKGTGTEHRGLDRETPEASL